MFELVKKVKILTVICCICSIHQFAFAQRVESSAERNDEVKEINGLYNQGKWEEGKGKAEAILEKNPKDADIRMLLGKYYLNTKQYDKARFQLVKSLEIMPDMVDAKHLLVTVETETKRYSSAICYINELLEVNPYWKGLWRKKIDLYRTVGNHVEADRLLKRISQIYPEDNDFKKDEMYILEQRQIAVQKAGKVDQAIDYAKSRIATEPNKQDSYQSIIDNYIKAGDYNNALVYTERGLNNFPNSDYFVQKKIAILEHQKRFPEVLSFLEQQMKKGGAPRSQYNYFLLEAARSAKQNDPASLYGKTFEIAPSNKEAFDYVFNDLVSKQQYEEAILLVKKHRKSVGDRKELDMRELTLYKRLGDKAKIASLTREYFMKYPGDSDLRDAYISVLTQEAKANMQDENIEEANRNWKEIIRFGDMEAIALAKRGLYNTYVSGNRLQEAINVLDDMLLDQPSNIDLMLKKSDLYDKLGDHESAISIYEQVLGLAMEDDRARLLSGYNDLLLSRVKSLREEYKLPEAKRLCERWLSMDTNNKEALLYMINLCYQLKDTDGMLRYARIAESEYEEDVFFKIKLAEALNQVPANFEDSWAMLHKEVQTKSYHEPLVNSFINSTEEYAGQLLKYKDFNTALIVLDTALYYKDNKSLKYMKGLAYEGLKNYDSAYVYQQFFEPSLLELDDFKSHLNFLASKTYHNNISISHLRARFGDGYAISSISTFEYSRLNSNGSSYVARANYAGREDGKGIQGQVEWTQPWGTKLSTRIDLALSNKYFAKVMANATALYDFKPTWQAEVGLGFRALYTEQNLFNLNVGLTKDFEDFKLSAKLNNFLLDSDGERIYLYSVGLKGQYFMNNPKNYLLAVGSVGNSPDIELLNNQFYNSFSVFNAMVGAGVGRSLAKNIGASVMGTWYNFRGESVLSPSSFRDFYNLYFQLNVSF
ncbi:tetratricopeptide repeat protein [Sphingobacterium rhinopitheci]|uniref:tetratricopeptide repeat protein n=1 Tax=Sphingobacterium rhinopitheci TaxID=2781960 RepID=UPI001F523292|nr:tetratricopeptide repeat protein [Sphingobacterium rhinopitheci]MCI0921248.1 tetratricopeptide repeat protein [Sphingobacterium rhinopitheci]